MSIVVDKEGWFQSSFELTGYITTSMSIVVDKEGWFQSSFELTGYITTKDCYNTAQEG